MNKRLIWALCVFSTVAQADLVRHQAPVKLELSSGLEPVCFYEDHRYSKGSVIEMGKQLFVCEREKSFEQNGRLSWHAFPLVESQQNKITIERGKL